MTDLYADFFKRRGDRANAQENLGKAIEILRKCGADGWVDASLDRIGLLA